MLRKQVHTFKQRLKWWKILFNLKRAIEAWIRLLELGKDLSSFINQSCLSWKYISGFYVKFHFRKKLFSLTFLHSFFLFGAEMLKTFVRNKFLYLLSIFTHINKLVFLVAKWNKKKTEANKMKNGFEKKNDINIMIFILLVIFFLFALLLNNQNELGIRNRKAFHSN